MCYCFLHTADIVIVPDRKQKEVFCMSVAMDIASASINLNEFRLKQAVEISMLKKTMELQELQVEYLIKDLPDIAAPSGSIIDVKA